MRNLSNLLWSSKFSSFYSPANYVLDKFARDLAALVKPDQKLLDAGAGNCPYKPYFSHCAYTSQDFCNGEYGLKYSEVDVKSEIYQIPLPDASFDFILCSQVFEHLHSPQKAMQELNRLLKPGGQLWLSVPHIWEEHDPPYDFYRYTQYGLKHLGEAHGFSLVKLQTSGGRFITLGKMLKDLFPGLTLNFKLSIILSIIQLPVMVPLLFVLYHLDKLDTKKDMTLNYMAVYEKS